MLHPSHWLSPTRAARLRSAAPVVAITLFALALRLAVTRGIWIDEAVSLRQARLPYLKMLAELRDADVHPPLYHSVLWVVVRLTGDTGELGLRVPSLVAGTALIPVLYGAANDLWDRRTGLLAALLGAVAPAAVWYSQEVRMYAFWIVEATLAIWAQCRIVRRPPGSAKDWVMFTVASAASLYTHLFAWLPLLAASLVFLVVGWTRRRARDARAFVRRWLWSMIGLAVLLLPLLPFLTIQVGAHLRWPPPAVAERISGDASFWANRPPNVYAALANVIWAVWGFHADATMVALGALWPVAILLGFALLGRGRSATVWVMLTVAVIPMLLLFAVAFKVRLAFDLRYFIVMVPVMLLLCARVVASWGAAPLTRIALPAVLVASMLVGLADEQLNPSNPRVYDFRGAMQWVRAHASADDELVYAPEYLYDALRYYRPGMPMRSSTDGPLPEPTSQRHVFVIGSFVEYPSIAGRLRGVLGEFNHTGRLVAHRHYPNVEIWEFA